MMAVTNICDRSKKVIFKLNKSFKGIDVNPRTSLNMFDKLVRPVMLYGCEIWGDTIIKGKSVCEEKMWRKILKSQIESVHMSFCKSCLGVDRKATNVAVMGELGRYPVFVQIVIQMVNFWQHVRDGEHSNPYLLDAGKEMILISHQDPRSWLNRLNMMCSTFMNDMYRAEINEYVRKNIKQEIISSYVRFWQKEVMSRDGDRGKLSFYKCFKTNCYREPYLDVIKCPKQRAALARLRTSSHQLQIERGRYVGTPRESRFCPHCYKQGEEYIEDETHFLLACPKFRGERESLMRVVREECKHFDTLENKQKMIYLMTAEGRTCKAVSNFCMLAS